MLNSDKRVDFIEFNTKKSLFRGFLLLKIYSNSESCGTYIKLSRTNKITVIADEIANDFDGRYDILPTDNRGIVYWYDLLETCKDSKDIMESTLKQFGVDSLDECYDYLDNL